MKTFLFLVILLFLFFSPVYSESEKPVSVGVKPYGSIPLGSSSELFKLGGGFGVSGFYLPERFRIAGIILESNYFVIPLENSLHCLQYQYQSVLFYDSQLESALQLSLMQESGITTGFR